MGCEESFITMKLIWHSYLVLSLRNCAHETPTEIGLIYPFLYLVAIYIFYAIRIQNNCISPTWKKIHLPLTAGPACQVGRCKSFEMLIKIANSKIFLLFWRFFFHCEIFLPGHSILPAHHTIIGSTFHFFTWLIKFIFTLICLRVTPPRLIRNPFLRNLATYAMQTTFVCKLWKFQSGPLDQHLRGGAQRRGRGDLQKCDYLILGRVQIVKLSHPPCLLDVDPMTQIKVSTVCIRMWFA